WLRLLHLSLPCDWSTCRTPEQGCSLPNSPAKSNVSLQCAVKRARVASTFAGGSRLRILLSASYSLPSPVPGDWRLRSQPVFQYACDAYDARPIQPVLQGILIVLQPGRY